MTLESKRRSWKIRAAGMGAVFAMQLFFGVAHAVHNGIIHGFGTTSFDAGFAAMDWFFWMTLQLASQSSPWLL